jgi:thiosulfate dehydrogenase
MFNTSSRSSTAKEKAMETFDKIRTAALAIITGGGLLCSNLSAEQFAEKDPALWKTAYISTVKEGRALFSSPDLGKKGACAQCHPNAANTYPETYPKFKKQLGKVITIGEQVNWCIVNALGGEKLGLDSKEMVSLIAYITHERRGVALAPGGKH